MLLSKGMGQVDCSSGCAVAGAVLFGLLKVDLER